MQIYNLPLIETKCGLLTPNPMGAVYSMSISVLSFSFHNAMSCAEFPHMT